MTTAARKLQGEIDKLFKKVAEGMSDFETIWSKFHATDHPNQREKYEQDLKREIKKLQRYRDQIRTWIAGNDVKDKNPLLEQRRCIEVQMERFKTLERELKTKAYSKEGLLAATSGDAKLAAVSASYMMNGKNDARVRTRLELREWVSEQIYTLQEQLESYEDELDQVDDDEDGGERKKPMNAPAKDVLSLQRYCERHKEHLMQLSKVIRSLDKDHMDLNALEVAKDDIEYYIENHAEPDFMENEAVYDDLGLDSITAEDDDDGDDSHDDREGNEEEENSSGTEENDDKRSSSTTTATSSRQNLHISSSSSSTSSTNLSNIGLSTSNILESTNAHSSMPDLSSSSFTKDSNTTFGHSSSSSSSSTSIDAVGLGRKQSIFDKKGTPSGISASASSILTMNPTSPLKGNATVKKTVWDAKSLIATKVPARRRVLPEEFSSRESMDSLDPQLFQVGVPQEDIVSSEDHTPSMYHFLCYPRHFYMTLPEYPKQPVKQVRDGISPPPFLSKTDVDTLFYLFYYHPGTLLQLHAARTLKDRGWTFHDKKMIWFQKSPSSINHEMVYFDHENGWCQRKRNDLVVE